MFSYLKGQIVSAEGGLLVLDCNGIGYELNVSNTAIVNLYGKKDIVKVYTYMAVREDGINLYGFYSQEEKAMFLKLIGVSGVGTKVAFSILSGITLSDFAMAIVTKDIKTLSKIKGLGKKTAERIILELKESISLSDSEEGELDYISSNVQMTMDKDTEDAILALRSLGITQVEAQNAVAKAKKIVGDDKIEALISQALKLLQ